MQIYDEDGIDSKELGALVDKGIKANKDGLKPCPFCGDSEIELTRRVTKKYLEVTIKCKGCVTKRTQRFIRLRDKGEQMMIEQWNRRHNDGEAP